MFLFCLSISDHENHSLFRPFSQRSLNQKMSTKTVRSTVRMDSTRISNQIYRFEFAQCIVYYRFFANFSQQHFDSFLNCGTENKIK